MKNAIALITIAGRTTPISKPTKGTSALKIKIAVDKKTVPDTNVPIHVRTTAIGNFLAYLLSNTTNPKKTKAVTDLSMIFGKNPPGNVENNPEITPVEIPSKKTLFTSGNNKMLINIIVSIKSGFIPPLNPGITIYSTAPTPINRDIKTKFFVFNSHLSSALLSYNL